MHGTVYVSLIMFLYQTEHEPVTRSAGWDVESIVNSLLEH